MDKKTFFLLCEEFTEKVKKELYKEMSEENWQTRKMKKTYCFGPKKEDLRLLIKKNGVFELTMNKKQENREKYQKMYDFLISFLKEKEADTLVKECYFEKENKKTKYGIVAIGEKSEILLDMIESMPYMMMDDVSNFYYKIPGKTPSYYFLLQAEPIPKIIIQIEGRIEGELKTKKEAVSFMENLQKEVNEMRRIQKETVDYILSKDVTAFTDDHYTIIQSFGERYYFSVQKVIKRKGVYFKAEFHESIISKNLEELEKKFKRSVEEYIKINRIKKTIEGKAHDVREKLLYAVNPYYNYLEKDVEIKTTVPMEEIIKEIANYLNKNKLEEIENTEEKSYKKAYKVKNYLLFYKFKTIKIKRA